MIVSLALFLVACTTDEVETWPIETGWRTEPGAVEPYLRSVEIYEVAGRWVIRADTVGLAASVEWGLDYSGQGEPHFLVADAWSPDDNHQDWMLEVPPALAGDAGRRLVIKSNVAPELGLNHFFRLQGPDGDTTDCALFGPDAAVLEAPGTIDGPCARLTYELARAWGE